MNMPWLKHYGDVPTTIEYPQVTMEQMLSQACEKYKDKTAYEFLGKNSTFAQLSLDIEKAARALLAIGVKKDDRITVCLPNTPHAVIIFYAINKIGAVANMIHPLSSKGEIKFFLNDAQSEYAITLDAFYPKFSGVKDKTKLKKTIICSIPDYLPSVKGMLFKLTKGRKIAAVEDTDVTPSWKSFMQKSESVINPIYPEYEEGKTAAILYSGGTTGVTKGIMLSDMNFNALALQVISMANTSIDNKKMLAVMPVFHGFGLGICIHAMLCHGVCDILIPQFDAKSYAELIVKTRPNFIAGVPTLFESMLRNEKLAKADLSCLNGVFVGGDSLTVELKRKFDAFLKQRNCTAQLREGYGTTECVTASCLTPRDEYIEGSIGIPFADTLYSICKPGTHEELPAGEDGEICISGPSVMLGYVNQPEENAKTLQKHDDGRIWLHTGDMGAMDEEGFIYFKQRIKRMIITSGYNVYPSAVENILEAHPDVHMSCVIGVADPVKVQKIKAFVVPASQKPANTLNSELMAYLKENVARYAMPYEIEFRDDLPRTKVGKVAYTVLEEQEIKREKEIKGEVQTLDQAEFVEKEVLPEMQLNEE